MINIDRMTIGEIAKIEELSGQSISILGDDAAPKAKLLAALVFVNKRRDLSAASNPIGGFTWNDALAMEFDEVSDYLGLNDDADADADADAVDADPNGPALTKTPRAKK